MGCGAGYSDNSVMIDRHALKRKETAVDGMKPLLFFH